MSNSRLVKVKIWCSQSQGHVRLSVRRGQPGVTEMLLELKEKVNTRACLSSNQYPVSKLFSEPSQKLLMDSFLNCCYIRIGLNLAAEINTAITFPKYQESRHSFTGPVLQSLSKLQSWCWLGCTFSHWDLSGEESASKLRWAVKFSSLGSIGTAVSGWLLTRGNPQFLEVSCISLPYVFP